MVDKLLKITGTVALYGCASLFLASLLLAAYLKYAWKIDNVKWVRMLAIAQGHDLLNLRRQVEDRIAEMSYEEVLQIRAKRLRDEEFEKETGGKPSETLIADEKKINAKLKEIKDSRTAFDKYVKDYLAKTTEAGLLEETRLIEQAKPVFAKEIILGLIKDHGAIERVLTMLLKMEEQRRGEILYQMKDEPELKELCNILQKIGNGEPLSKVIEDAKKAAERPPPTSP